MTTLTEYIEDLTRPIDVMVIDPEDKVAHEIRTALTVYNCKVNLVTAPVLHLNEVIPITAQLVFLADNLPGSIDTVAILSLLEAQVEVPSVVILTRQPFSERIAGLMKRGPYTFLVKNGSFTETHVRRVFCQLNLRLRDSGQPESGEKKLCPAVV